MDQKLSDLVFILGMDYKGQIISRPKEQFDRIIYDPRYGSPVECAMFMLDLTSK